jgi:hypothetical protein
MSSVTYASRRLRCGNALTTSGARERYGVEGQPVSSFHLTAVRHRWQIADCSRPAPASEFSRGGRSSRCCASGRRTGRPLRFRARVRRVLHGRATHGTRPPQKDAGELGQMRLRVRSTCRQRTARSGDTALARVAARSTSETAWTAARSVAIHPGARRRRRAHAAGAAVLALREAPRGHPSHRRPTPGHWQARRGRARCARRRSTRSWRRTHASPSARRGRRRNRTLFGSDQTPL